MQALALSENSTFTPVRDWPQHEETSIERSVHNILHKATLGINLVYKACNSDFKAIEVLPQRLLTNPSESAANGGLDNADGNLICRVHDKIYHENITFTILDLLGTGTFGQVFRCKRDDTKELVAVKVIKNKPAYHTQGLLEIKIARLLNTNYDPNNDKHIVRLLDSFEYHGHTCLVFELLSMSLLDLLTQNQFRGLPLAIVQKFAKQILIALIVLEDANIIHCDLKPENILLVPSNSKRKTNTNKVNDTNKDGKSSNERQKLKEPRRTSSASSDIKVIDFGSACFEGRTIYSYIQSRFCKLFFFLFILLLSYLLSIFD
jgi:dual specificity protein kinase YAK1